MKKLVGIAALVAFAGAAQGQVVISEVLGSTGGTDAEFIELANIGGAPVDISGYQIELWDSDAAAIPSQDAGSPYIVSAGVTLNPGEVYTFGGSIASGGVYAAPNPTTFNGQPFTFDQTLPANAIENSSYTIILTDSTGTPVLDSWFFSDDDAGDFANRNGSAISPSINVPLDGSFLAPGFARTDTAGNGVLLHFSTPGFGPPELNDGTIQGGTPGIYQIPTPGALALAGIAGLAAGRRRRA